MEIVLRKAAWEESETAYGFIQEARDFQRQQGFVQWTDNYPGPADIAEDIRAGKGYLVVEGEVPLGYIFLDFQGDPDYEEIEGCWMTQGRYAVMHKVAFGSIVRGKGVTRQLFALVRKMCTEQEISSLRIDTHEENLRMQHILAREGFVHCGTVQVKNGPRLAYELVF